MNEPTSLKVEDRDNGLKLIHFYGDLDSLGSRTVEKSFAEAINDRTNRVLVELSHVDFISSAGLAMLLVKGKMLREAGGNMIIVGASQRVHEVLILAGFHDLFNIYETLNEALENLG